MDLVETPSVVDKRREQVKATGTFTEASSLKWATSGRVTETGLSASFRKANFTIA